MRKEPRIPALPSRADTPVDARPDRQCPPSYLTFLICMTDLEFIKFEVR